MQKVRQVIQIDGIFLTLDLSSRLKEWASSNRSGDLSASVEHLLRQALGLPQEETPRSLTGLQFLRTIDLQEAARLLPIDPAEVIQQWYQCPPNQFVEWFNAMAAGPGWLIEFDPTANSPQFNLYQLEFAAAVA